MKIFLAMRKCCLILLLAVLGLPVGSWAQGGTGETIYVTNFDGGQVVKVVDGGTTSVVNTSTGEFPEGIVVGPDGKVYVFDPDNSDIRRIDPSNPDAAPETVYTKGESSGPSGPEGGSFNSNGDLFFNTRGYPETHTGVWKITSAQLKGPLPVTPTQVLTAAQTGSTFGEGTTFDANDNLLVVDGNGGRLLRSSPPYTSVTAIINEGGGENPPFLDGVAVNGAGDIFLSNEFAATGGNVVHYGPNGGTAIEVYASFTDPAFFLQFDASGRLYVATTVDRVPGTGKLWRIDPPGGAANKHLVVDFATLDIGLNSITTPGVALAPTTFTTPQQPVSPGSTTTFSDGNVIKETLVLPGSVNMGNTAFKSVSFIEETPADFSSNRLSVVVAQNPNWSGGTTPIPNAAAGTSCTPIAGKGGNCVVVRDLCFDMNHNPIIPCDITAPTAPVQLIYNYNTQSPQPNPAVIIADDNQNNWANITSGFTDCCTIGGHSKGINTETAIVNLGGPLPGPADLGIGMIGNLSVESGDNVTYFLGAANRGPNTAELVTVQDTLPPNTTLVSAGFTLESCSNFLGIPICPFSRPANLCLASGGLVTCYLGTLEAGQHDNGAIIEIKVKVTAPARTTIEDTATVTGLNTDPNMKNNTTKWFTRVTPADKD